MKNVKMIGIALAGLLAASPVKAAMDIAPPVKVTWNGFIHAWSSLGENAQQDRDNADHHEQFDEREAPTVSLIATAHVRCSEMNARRPHSSWMRASAFPTSRRAVAAQPNQISTLAQQSARQNCVTSCCQYGNYVLPENSFGGWTRLWRRWTGSIILCEPAADTP